MQEGHAYHCFCSQERLETLRAAQAKRGQNIMYDRACLKLPKEEVAQRLKDGVPHVIRMKVPEGSTVVEDEVLGQVSFQHNVLDDQVI